MQSIIKCDQNYHYCIYHFFPVYLEISYLFRILMPPHIFGKFFIWLTTYVDHQQCMCSQPKAGFSNRPLNDN